MQAVQRFCRVAVDSPVLALDRPFDYQIPDRMLGRVGVGSVVRVPLHGRRVRAFVVEMLDEAAVPVAKSLSALVSPEPLFTAAEVDLARWTARRYVTSTGAVFHHAVPGRYSAPARRTDVARSREEAVAPAWLSSVTDVAGVVAGAEAGVLVVPDRRAEPEAVAAFASATGDGQTLVVAPRIAVAERIADQLDGAALLHGDQRPSDRARSWAAARDGEIRVLVGGRAALFAPVPQLRLVMVASAHDRSLKEERAPRLHALWVARRRARVAGAAFVASSPAPPLDLRATDEGFSWWEARAGRAGVRPEVTRPRPGPITPRLVETVRWATGNARDTLVFIGRRGFALRIRCDDCGWFPRCEGCGTGLTTYGQGSATVLRCRGCGDTKTPPTACPDCRGVNLKGRGWGSERLAAELEGQDLGAPVIRVDAEASLPVDRPRPAVVVGTQAAVWALEGADVAAVCVADLDQLLGVADFRAGEHALQTLHDLAGVLAPGGRFLLQTREPDHHVVQAFTRRSFGFFAERELPLRRAASYPPFGAVVRVELDPGSVSALRDHVASSGGDVVGPLPRPRGGAAVLIRAPAVEPLLEPLRAFAEGHPKARIDVDPVDV